MTIYTLLKNYKNSNFIILLKLLKIDVTEIKVKSFTFQFRSVFLWSKDWN